MVSFSAFWVTVAALGATVLTAWGGYGKNSEVGLSLKRVGPLPAVKVIWPWKSNTLCSSANHSVTCNHMLADVQPFPNPVV